MAGLVRGTRRFPAKRRRGPRAKSRDYFGDRQRVQTLRQTVAVDWAFDPASFMHAEAGERPILRVVTRIDGSDFETLWEGAEPNEMIRDYLLIVSHAPRHHDQ